MKYFILYSLGKGKLLTNFYARKLLVKIFDKGKCIYKTPPIDEIRDYCAKEIETLWEEVLRFENPMNIL